MDKLDQRVNISLTFTKYFYTCNIKSLLFFTIIIVPFVYKLNYTPNNAKIKFVNIYNINRRLLPVSQLVRVNSIRCFISFYLKASIAGSCKYRRLDAFNCFIDFKFQPPSIQISSYYIFHCLQAMLSQVKHFQIIYFVSFFS